MTLTVEALKAIIGDHADDQPVIVATGDFRKPFAPVHAVADDGDRLVLEL